MEEEKNVLWGGSGQSEKISLMDKEHISDIFRDSLRVFRSTPVDCRLFIYVFVGFDWLGLSHFCNCEIVDR